MSEMKKLAAQVPAVLSQASTHMRKMASENVALAQENDQLKHELRVTKIARRMEERGLEPNQDYESKIASLRDLDSSKLDALEQAVELSAGGLKLGSLHVPQERASAEGGESGASNHEALDDFVLSNQAYS